MKEKLVDKRTGLIKELLYENHVLGMIPMYMTIATRHAVKNDNLDVIIPAISNGLGADFFSINKTEIAAIGETVERYCSVFLESELIQGSYEELSVNMNLINPEEVTRLSDGQLEEMNLKLMKVDESTEFYWIKGLDIEEQKDTWIPTDLAHLYPLLNNKYPIRDIVSTGLATGNSIKDSVTRGMLECIERDSIVIMWLNKIPYPIVNLDSIESEEIKDVINLIQSANSNIQVTILDISTDINVPTYFSILKSENFPYLSVGASCDFNSITAINKSLTEAAASYNLSLKRYHSNQINFKSGYPISSMENHSDYFALNPIESISKELNFLFEGKVIDFEPYSVNKIRNYDDLLKELNNLNIKSYMVDLTTSDIKSINLNVVRIVMPKLAFLEVSTPLLNCERIFTVPQKLGFKSPSKLNDVIHPFP